MSHHADNMDIYESNKDLFGNDETTAPVVSIPQNEDTVMDSSEKAGRDAEVAMDEDVGDAMEGIKISAGTVNVKLADLTPTQRKLILESKPDVYYIDVTVGMSELYELRGQDVPSKGLGSSMKTPCVMATRKNVDSAGGKATFTGPSIDVTKVDADGKKIAAPLERVHVRFLLSTQMPSIEISTRCDGTKATKSEQPVTTRLYAQDLQLNPRTRQVMMYARPPSVDANAPNRFDAKGQNPGNANVQELKSMAEQKQLFEIILVVCQDRPSSKWTGMPAHVANELVNGASPSEADAPEVTTRDSLIQQMGQKDTNVISFLTFIKPNQVEGHGLRPKGLLKTSMVISEQFERSAALLVSTVVEVRRQRFVAGGSVAILGEDERGVVAMLWRRQRN
ncbi:hypothetical protein OPT61_g2027 [Boeremia exigua]|uniref:Uncharacterized protein n=1 Tax=Boeremia exigua TaxID=749465 RepID=A0ACC2IN79_9PLEO|nr:hypothetical protein OPT61_g2027 [Boeremia exigua]